MTSLDQKIKLYGFNNLTKTLSFNIHDICYAKTAESKWKYLEYIDEQYNSTRLTQILENVTQIIGAKILNIAKQDYDPQGASVTLLISEEEVPEEVVDASCNRGILPVYKDSVVCHLDKSHVTVHTYPESHPDDGISTFRVDIDVSTCGDISPLNALEFLINSFDSDIIVIDYRVRGFTRGIDGKKIFIDHDINSVQDYIPPWISARYDMIDTNFQTENIFHTKMLIKDFQLDNYLFGIQEEEDLSKQERDFISQKLRKEMHEIFYGKNFHWFF
ncbi:MAG: adenosylmethionine decarboxylase [Planctomycetes bacterium]|mgnify:CR=1 FL=1|jgi:S-adenosylmethionine decarboxylase|nr:adenosylmethionine decarboxylase [Planctomycetota bacterium]HNZ66090.1 adenosylmethionine decarboxylase [Planctomycetota bacterium]HON44546.1 adenosylmethionine decarboxylase [Planctomycetota bacterium]HPY75813.1 adenosylmethionine decarboxylase [Planctomycetota bacterium]HQB00317.1 adenosylmethionine decarboxylase [Planctomycetota bacterium]